MTSLLSWETPFLRLETGGLWIVTTETNPVWAQMVSIHEYHIHLGNTHTVLRKITHAPYIPEESANDFKYYFDEIS